MEWRERLRNLGDYQRGIGVGVIVAFAGSLIFFLLISLVFSSTKKEVELLALKSSLALGQELQKQDLEVAKVPKQYVPPGAIFPQDWELILHKRPRVPLEAGSWLRWHDLEGEEDPLNSLSVKIPAGYRALTLPMVRNQGLLDLLMPGDGIDILGTFSPPEKEDTAVVTKTLFQNIKVLKAKPDLILLVTPNQAELLLFANHQGSMAFTLRNPQDEENLESLPTREFQALLGIKKKRKKTKEKVSPLPQVLSLSKRKKTS